MELSDGIAMMVGNNDRMQGIISQLEETCRAIEVSLLLLTPPCNLYSAQHTHTRMHQLWPVQTLKHTRSRTPWNCFWTHFSPSEWFLWVERVFMIRLICHPWPWRRTVAGRRLWFARSSTSCIPCWRRRRGRWARKWRTNRKRSWTISVAWPGSTETTWSRAVRSWRWASRPWRSQKWLYSYRSDLISESICSKFQILIKKNTSYFFDLPQNTKPLLKKWVHVLYINAINNNFKAFFLHLFVFFCVLVDDLTS